MQIFGGTEYNKAWIEGVIPDNAKASLSQCFNDITKLTSWEGSAVHHYKTSLTFNTEPIYHVSAGKIGTNKSCTLFFTQLSGQAYIFAVAQHKGPVTYTILFHRPSYASFSGTVDITKGTNYS